MNLKEKLIKEKRTRWLDVGCGGNFEDGFYYLDTFPEGIIDPRSGRVINNNLADYLVAVNADVPAITTIDVGLPDTQATVLGGKAVGELGIVGVAAAISNAVYHATGKRVRDLPITLDKLI